jgi:MFS family permease
LPTLCRSPAELTGANVARGVLDSASMLLGPLAAAGLLALSGPAAVLITAAGAAAVAAGAIGSLAYDAPPRLDPAGPPIDGLGSGLRAVAREPMLALLTALATLQTFVRGALTVFSVSIALDLLRSGNAEVGILTAALGLGALAGSLSAAALVGHGSLARWFGAGVATWGAPLIVIGLSATRGTVIAMVAVVGVGNALVDVGVFTLLARLADDTVLARVYAAFEGTITFGAAAGSLLAPALIGALGLRGALAAVGAVPPLGVLAAWPALRRLDSRIAVRDEDVTLLRSIPLFRPLPVATIEQLAARATRDRWPAEAWVCRQGEAGEQFFVIENGRAEVFVDGRRVRELGPGDSFGEIALVRNCARTASVRAIAPLTVRVLARAAFVAATMGYAASAEVTRVLIEGHLQRDGAGAGRGGHASVPRPPVPSPPYGPPEQSEPHDGSARRDLPM